MRRSVFPMTRTQWIAGSLVFLATIICGALSAPLAERTFSRPAPADAANTTDAMHSRTCITLTGKRVEWNFPNPPFGTLSCSQ